jgi:hypothetical protein
MKRFAFLFVLLFLPDLVGPVWGATRDAGAPFGELELVDEILLGSDTAHEFQESGEGHSEIQTLLGTEARVLPNDGGPRYFAYRVGQGKGLVAGQAYVLEVAYPEDEPRTVFVRNKGAETTRGFATSTTFGDAVRGYAVTSLESLDYPLSGQTESYRQLFWLHDRFADIAGGDRSFTPEDGFWVIIAQPGSWLGSASEPRQAPFSKGPAVSAIRLYAVPDPGVYDLAIHYPPGDLPRRHIFYREEMSDSVVHSRTEEERGVNDDIAWYEYKAKLMNFLGMNTFSKDLLEFGANQGWDSSPHGGNDWVHQTSFPDRWAKILDMLGSYEHSVLPYYEYCGSKGDHGLGYEHRSRPLSRDPASGESVPCEGYTHIWWAERCNADLTDPETFEDFRKMLELTVVAYKDEVNFVGAWMRTRVSSLPISFSDATLQRYSDDALGGAPLSREDLRSDTDAYHAYRDWWEGQRKAFLAKIQSYLAQALGGEPVLLYSAYPGEGGPWVNGGAVTDDVDRIEAVGKTGQDIDTFVADGKYLDALLGDRSNWDDYSCSDPDKKTYEWQHSVPRPDPENYADGTGTLMAYPFNHQFTTRSETVLDAFRTESGLAMIRHFSLNENTMTAESGDLIGYFVSDVDRARDFSMLAEAQALAFGDPKYLGYLAASTFTRGFPTPTRDFNAAFLALPAVDSVILADSASDQEVIVRAYETAEYGTFLAIVNTGMRPKQAVVITLPGVDLAATNRVSMKAMPVEDDALTLDLKVAGVVVVQLLPKDGTGTGESTDDKECGCSGGGTNGLGWFALLLVVPLLRRKRVA